MRDKLCQCEPINRIYKNDGPKDNENDTDKDKQLSEAPRSYNVIERHNFR